MRVAISEIQFRGMDSGLRGMDPGFAYSAPREDGYVSFLHATHCLGKTAVVLRVDSVGALRRISRRTAPFRLLGMCYLLLAAIASRRSRNCLGGT